MPGAVNYTLQDMLELAENSPALVKAAGSKENLEKTVRNAYEQDRIFFKENGRFFDGGTGEKDFQNSYMTTYGGSYEKHPPSLLATSINNAGKLGIAPGSKGFELVMKSAILAELDKPQADANGYHNSSHFSQVSDVTTYLQNKTDEMAAAGDRRVTAQTPDRKAMTLSTAICHDLGHTGKGNNAELDKFGNEKASFEAFRPLMEETGYSANDIKISKATFMATSPNGGIQIVDDVLEMEKDGHIDIGKLREKYPDAPAELLEAVQSPEILRQNIGPVMDADMAGSAYAGKEANRINSKNLVAETGIKALGSPQSRVWYLENLVKNTVSPAAQETIAVNKTNLLETTKESLSIKKRIAEGMTEAASMRIPDAPHHKGGLMGKIVETTATASGIMAGGMSVTEAAEEGYKNLAPFGDTQIEAAKAAYAASQGDTKATAEHLENVKETASINTASAISGGTAGTILAKTAMGSEALLEGRTIISGGITGMAEMAEALGTGMLARTGAKIALGAAATTGVGLAAGIVIELGINELEELRKQGHAEYLKGGKVDTIEETRALQNALLDSPSSPLPHSVSFGDKEMSIGMALHEHPEKIESIMKNSPEALERIGQWKALEEYGKGLMNNTITPGTAAPIQIASQNQKENKTDASSDIIHQQRNNSFPTAQM